MNDKEKNDTNSRCGVRSSGIGSDGGGDDADEEGMRVLSIEITKV